MADEPNEPTRGLTPERKAACRTDYANGFELDGKSYRPGSIAPLARKYGVSRNGLKRWIHDLADPWTISDQGADHLVTEGQPTAQEVRAAVTAKVVSITTGKALEAAEAAGVMQTAAEAGAEIAAELLATQTVTRIAAEYMQDFFGKLKKGDVKPAKGPGQQTEADVAATAMRALKTFVETTRKNTGLRDGVASVPTGEEDGAAQLVEFVIVDRPTGTEGAGPGGPPT